MTIYETMLAQYNEEHGTATPNASHEVMQQLVLAGLNRGGFFKHAAFYGGTCLRIFHGLPRFSEDLDFSLIDKRDDIHLDNYFPSIVEEFNISGLDVTITKKEKKIFGRVESAFLKENTEAYEIKFQTKKTVKIKIELDTDPPLQFNTEQKLLLQPYSFMPRCFTLPDLYAARCTHLSIELGNGVSRGVTGTILNGMFAMVYHWISIISRLESKSLVVRMLTKKHF